MAAIDNIFQIKQIRNEQTINTNRWTLVFDNLSAILNRAKNHPLPAIRQRAKAVAAAISNNPGRSLELSLFSVTLPSVTLETQSISRFNDTIKAVTKFAEMEEMTTTFWDYVNGSASAIMQLWHALVGDKKTGAIGFKRDFTLPKAYFYVFGPDAPGYEEAVEGANYDTLNGIPYLQKYEIWNLFPSKVDLGEHNDSAEARKVTVSFHVDNIFPVNIQAYGVSTPDKLAEYIPSLTKEELAASNG